MKILLEVIHRICGLHVASCNVTRVRVGYSQHIAHIVVRLFRKKDAIGFIWRNRQFHHKLVRSIY